MFVDSYHKAVKAGVFVFTSHSCAFDSTVSAVAAFSVLSDKIGESIGDAEINTEGLKLMVKTAGVSVVTEIASAVCRDASETALAKTAELIGKITIAGMILPVIGEIIKLCVSLCGK